MIRLIFTCFIILFIGSLNVLIVHAETYTLAYGFGTTGSGDGQFSSPRGIALDSSDNIYVADTGNNRIEKFDKDGTYLSQFGSRGSENGQFVEPTGVAVDSADNIYVADNANRRVQKFDRTGKFITQWRSDATGDGIELVPYDVAVDSANNIYVSDNGQGKLGHFRIVKFSNDGVYLKQWNTENQVIPFTGIAVDSSDNVYGITGNYFQKFDNSGNSLYQSKGITFGNPLGIAADSANNIYITAAWDNKVRKFDSTGKLATEWGTKGSDTGQFKYPTGIAVDSANKVYVVDSGNNRIQIFKKSTVTTADFTSSASSGAVPLEVKFKDASESANKWSWDFGDGATSIEHNPTHTYTTAGKYTVKLTATGETNSDTKSKADYIDAVGVAPTPETIPTVTTTPATTETPTVTPTTTEKLVIASTNSWVTIICLVTAILGLVTACIHYINEKNKPEKNKPK